MTPVEWGVVLKEIAPSGEPRNRQVRAGVKED